MRDPLLVLKKAYVLRVKKRSSSWAKIRAQHLEDEPFCQWCGSTKDLQVHHVIPFDDNPALELDQTNLITLCEKVGVGCHLLIGHHGNFKYHHPTVREDCNAHRKDRHYRAKP